MTGSKGLPLAKMPLPPDQVSASSAVHSDLEVGFDSAKMIVTIPDEPKYRGKKYAGLIRSSLAKGFWLDSTVRVLITTEGTAEAEVEKKAKEELKE